MNRILFVFEGKKREIRLYNTMKYLFLDNSNHDSEIIISYCSNIFSLYNKMLQYGDEADIVHILKEEKCHCSKGKDELDKINYSYQISQIYLFFDYDLQQKNQYNKLTVQEQNEYIKNLIDYFSEETLNGKLYINYPMIESIRYFKNPLPDDQYHLYEIEMENNKTFKESAHFETHYSNLDFISFKTNKKNNKINLPRKEENKLDENKIQTIRENWKHINKMNVKKAHYICCECNEIPSQKKIISQKNIFVNQIEKYVSKRKIAILNSLPLFLYEYLKTPFS